MDPIYTIIRQNVIDPATWGANKTYTFEVSKEASDAEIKRGIESLYAVRVRSITSQTRLVRGPSITYGHIQGKTWKQATIKIHPDDTIPQDTENI